MNSGTSSTDLVRQAIEHLQSGRLPDAAALCRRALSVAPDCADALLCLGRIELASGHPQDCRQLLRRYAQLRPDDPAAHMQLSAAYSAEDKTQHALDECERAIALRPEEDSWHRHRGDLLQTLARYDEAAEVYQQLLARWPDDPIAWHQLGAARRRQGDFSGAEQALRQALRLKPSMTEALINLGLLLRDQSRFEESLQCLEQAAANAPDDARPLCFLGTVYLAAGQPRLACSTLERSLAVNPYFRESLAYFAVALNEAGARAEAEQLLGFDLFLRAWDLEPQPGYASAEEFNQALVSHVQNHSSLVYERAGNTTRGGYHTGNLLDDSPGPVTDLCRVIDHRVREYFDALPGAGNHPYLWWKPQRWDLQIWGVVLKEGGHQEAHIHRDGWLSGVYYAQVPSTVSRGGGQEGWLEIGRPPAAVNCRRSPITTALRPREGMMVLFPSYFFHETLPFAGEEPRICVAFDVRPIIENGAAKGQG